jgi:glycine/D-amino acid oxidase-like deaminating enzyme
VEPIDTLIVGGGISGLACARHLHDAGHSFLLVTDRLGGRMYHSADGLINFGATYINEDYRHVSRYVGRGIPFRLREAYCENDGRLTTLLHWKNLRFAGSAARLVLRLRELRRQLRAFRAESEHTAQRDLLAKYPLLARYARQSAPELIDELRLHALHEHHFNLAFQATCFVDPRRVNALFYLGTLFPVIVPTWVADFTHTYARLTAGWADRLRIDFVNALGRADGGRWHVGTASGRTFHARTVVLAVPYHNASALYPVPRPYLPTSGTLLAARGRKRAAYHRRRFILLHPEQTGVALVWQQNGHDLVFCTRPRPDLAAVYEQPEILGAVTWKTAVVVSGGDWAPLRLEDGLYLAGDYNLCGLEDSFLSGLCAANQILKQAAVRGETA